MKKGGERRERFALKREKREKEKEKMRKNVSLPLLYLSRTDPFLSKPTQPQNQAQRASPP